MSSGDSGENYPLDLPYKPSSVSVYWKKVTVPKGLPSLLETFVKETIRENPDDIYSFLADLTESLLAKRAAEEKEAESGNASKNVNATSSDDSIKIKPADVETPIESANASIPTSFQLEEQEELKRIKEDIVVSPEKSLPSSEKEEDVSNALAEQKSFEASVQENLGDGPKYNDVAVNVEEPPLPEEIAAATVLQSGFRGYKTRKELSKQKQEGKDASNVIAPISNTDDDDGEVVDESKNDSSLTTSALVEDPLPEEVKAATTLQAGFRGYKTRKGLKKEQNKEEKDAEDAHDRSESSARPDLETYLEDELESKTETEDAKSPTPDIKSPTPDAATPPAATSPDPFEDAEVDEEIASKLDMPLEIIREESFDQSQSSASQAKAQEEEPEPEVTAASNERPSESSDETGCFNEIDIEDRIITTVSFLTKPEEKTNVDVISNDEIDAALGFLNDSDGDDDGGSNHHGDECIATDDDDGKSLCVEEDVLASLQDCDQQLVATEIAASVSEDYKEVEGENLNSAEEPGDHTPVLSPGENKELDKVEEKDNADDDDGSAADEDAGGSAEGNKNELEREGIDNLGDTANPEQPDVNVIDGEAEEKSESVHSEEKEDTDIATPTDFEGKDSLEDLNKMETNFEVESAVSSDEKGSSLPPEQSEGSSSETATPQEEIMQVEVKPADEAPCRDKDVVDECVDGTSALSQELSVDDPGHESGLISKDELEVPDQSNEAFQPEVEAEPTFVSEQVDSKQVQPEAAAEINTNEPEDPTLPQSAADLQDGVSGEAESKLSPLKNCEPTPEPNNDSLGNEELQSPTPVLPPVQSPSDSITDLAEEGKLEIPLEENETQTTEDANVPPVSETGPADEISLPASPAPESSKPTTPAPELSKPTTPAPDRSGPTSPVSEESPPATPVPGPSSSPGPNDSDQPIPESLSSTVEENTEIAKVPDHTIDTQDPGNVDVNDEINDKTSPVPIPVKPSEPSSEKSNIAKPEEHSKGEATEEKQEKPAVKPRLSKPAKSLASDSSTTPDPEQQQSPSQSPSVLRRPKSGSARSRATNSKYRSGIVIDNQVSMDEMEKEIEKEMMQTAAIKIQKNYRGFKTRKQLGVSKVKNDDSPAENVASATVPVLNDESASEKATAQLSSQAEAGRESEKEAEALASNICTKPPLATLRSQSLPGSYDVPEESNTPMNILDEGGEDHLMKSEADLELDPDYVNRAATRIQANFRGYRVRKVIKRPTSGKENNREKLSSKSKRMSEKEEVEAQKLNNEAMHRLHDKNDNGDNEPVEAAAAKIQASYRSFKERQKFHQKKKAAITIQATIRGYLTRKKVANIRRRSFQRRRSSVKSLQKELDDIQKLEHAAVKIQKVFRGYQVRSKISPRSNNMMDEQEQVNVNE